ncbi:uncharacterized protein LOC131681938 [Topomyia yanbarensis]|uniref:uncharacterized protein LOC131681938 n=1 Tax=Topomyia yanbarensis TaxID=2498891 RepID=UPI00273C584E|nr:uncharacterized protein LOC131681938 [Topomyia yanbarensis]
MCWDDVLFEAEYHLNNSFNRSIDNSPAVLLFGVKQRLHPKSDIERFLEGINTNVDRNLEKIRNEAEEKIKQLQKYNKLKYDEKCKRNTVYQEGDLVVIRAVKVPGENSKLKAKYRGPYQIRGVLDNNRYIVSDLDGYQMTSTHFDGTFGPLNLRLYRQAVNREEPVSFASSCSSDESDFCGFP